MRVERLVAAGSTALMLAGMAIAGASPASADTTWSGTVTTSSTNIQTGYPLADCTWAVRPTDAIYSESTTFTSAVEGTHTFRLTSAVMDGDDTPSVTALALFQPSYGVGNCVRSALFYSSSVEPRVLTATLTAGTTYTLLFWGTRNGNGGVATTGTFSVDSIPRSVDPSPSPAETADESPIPAWLQAYGRASKDATCLDGWDASWQSWAEPVTGGWVCTRSIPSLG